MIQRIQTIYLAIVLVLSLFFLRGTVFNCVDETGQTVKLMLSGSLAGNGGEPFAQVGPLWPLVAASALLAILSATALMLFSKRVVQMRITLFIIALSVVQTLILAFYAWTVTDKYKLSIVPGFKLAMPLLMILFSVLSYRGIRKDEQLVRSYDRLR